MKRKSNELLNLTADVVGSLLKPMRHGAALASYLRVVVDEVIVEGSSAIKTQLAVDISVRQQ